jgi:hypothetical protein
MDIRGESHLTIDDGSSNLISRLSKLSSGPFSQRNIDDIRSGFIGTFSSLVMPFSTFLWRGNYMDLSSAHLFFTQNIKRDRTYGANPSMSLSGGTVHLIPESLDVVQAVTDDY